MAMPTLPNAPQDITPKKFFTEWLPGQLAPFKDAIKQFGGDLKACMSFKVEGDQGGEWTTALEAGDVKVESGIKDSAVVTLIIAQKDFLDVVTGKRKMNLQPPGGGRGAPKPEDIPKQIKNVIDTLSGVEGMFQFRVEDPGNDFVVTVKFKGPIKKEPDTIVSIDRADADAMAKGELNPQAAFMGGKIRITGDMGLLMQMAPLMMQ
jgi:putative sterol carrier protein